MLSREQLDMYSIWRCKCIDTMKDKLRLNVAARSKKLEEVVNDCIMNINKELQININHNELNRFQLSDNLILSSLEEMYNKLDSWNGVNISSCKKIPHSFDEYWYIADNWWNRQKAFWFGDYYFYQLFIYLYNFCSSSSSNNIYRDILFYNILYDIINANVSFKRARPQPLLFDQSLEKSTDLKQYFIQLLSIQQFTSQSKQKINKKNRPKLRSIICQKITQIKDRKFNAYFKHFSSSSSSLTATTTATTTNYTNYSNDNNRQSRTYINNNNIPPTISIPTPTPIPIPMPISLTTANSINSSNSTPIPVSTPTSTTSSSLSLSSSSCTIPIYHPPQQQQQQSQYQQFGQQSLPQQTQQQQQQFVDINNNNNNNNINAFDTYQNNANICNYNHVQNAINESSMNIFNDNNTIFCNYENNQQLSGFGTIYVNDDDDDNDIFVGDHVNDLNMDNKSYFVENTLLQNEDDMMSLLNFPPSFAPINNNYNNYNNNNNNNNNNYNNNNNNALY